MPDDLQRQHCQSSDNTQNRLRDTSPHSLANLQGQQGMEFDSYPQQHFGAGGYSGGNTMDMRNLAGALPDYPTRPFQNQPYHHQMQQPQQSNQNVMYQYPQGAQFAGQTANNYSSSFQPFATQLPQSHQVRQQAVPYHGYQGGQQQGQSSMQGFPAQQNLYASSQQGQQFSQPGGPTYGQSYMARNAMQPPQLRLNSNMMGMQGVPLYSQPAPQPVRRTSSNSSLQATALRGPPRKPKQSGHALWVGNLPPGARIDDLKDHFSRDAFDDIESVFLISKSNCAFVNYKSEDSCTAAMARFHDSRFQGVRLVCRLRRGSSSQSPAPQDTSTVLTPTISAAPLHDQQSPDERASIADTAVEGLPQEEKVQEKYFVVKSLTIEDLERSVQTGVWATQAHNEAALNKAYQTAENVYLIFSANKSGEYFGYAKMDTAIDDEAASKLEMPSRPESAEPLPSDLPLTIPTPATTTAPKGRIIDDSARGTIFWEADHIDTETTKNEIEDPSGEGYESGMSNSLSPATPQAFGKPFKIVWLSTDRLPFYRTRGLRNPWNANREVKIARDGTEIEPSVGRRLIGMFHRPYVGSASPGSRQPSGMMQMQGQYMGGPQSQMGYGGSY